MGVDDGGFLTLGISLYLPISKTAIHDSFILEPRNKEARRVLLLYERSQPLMLEYIRIVYLRM